MFAGYLALSGTFWNPLPEHCPGPPVNLFHVHGRSDPVVPLAGRPIQDTSQGDVYEALALFREAGGFGEPRTFEVLDLDCTRETNASGKVLELCLHAGGHEMKAAYVARVWRELEALGALN
jgi:polyhydroxybutyrate depolymerase